MEKARFAARLRELRESRGLSQETLASQAGLHRTYVSQLERAHKSPTLDTLGKLCRVLSIKVSDFIAAMEES